MPHFETKRHIVQRGLQLTIVVIEGGWKQCLCFSQGGLKLQQK
jgi:hypothetical protein